MKGIEDALHNKRILVTGGAGAIGSNLAKAICGRNDVIVIDDLSSGHEELVPAGARFVKASILDDAALDECFTAFRPQVVFHLAALFANQNSVDHPKADLLANGLGTVKLLERAESLDCLEKFVFASSSCVYSTNKIPFSENDQVMACSTPYAITKMMGEMYCNYWHGNKGMPTTTVRLFNVYGPGEYPGRYRNVIPNFISKALKREPLLITGTGMETRDFTFIGDVIKGLELVALKPSTIGKVFNLGTGSETRIQDLAEMINAVCGNDAGIETAAKRNWDHYTRRSADISQAVDLLGYAPFVKLEDGLKTTVSWFREHLSRHLNRNP